VTSILREPAAYSFGVEYASSSFLQNVPKYVAEHMALHGMASHHRRRYFIKINSLRKPPTFSLVAVNNC
jgi:hypothetical protein